MPVISISLPRILTVGVLGRTLKLLVVALHNCQDDLCSSHEGPLYINVSYPFADFNLWRSGDWRSSIVVEHTSYATSFAELQCMRIGMGRECVTVLAWHSQAAYQIYVRSHRRTVFCTLMHASTLVFSNWIVAWCEGLILTNLQCSPSLPPAALMTRGEVTPLSDKSICQHSRGFSPSSIECLHTFLRSEIDPLMPQAVRQAGEWLLPLHHVITTGLLFDHYICTICIAGQLWGDRRIDSYIRNCSSYSIDRG